MIDKSWSDIKNQIIQASSSKIIGSDVNHLSSLETHFLPVIESLEMLNFEKPITKYLSMFCLQASPNCLNSNQSSRFLFVSICPPVNLLTESTVEFSVTLLDSNQQGEHQVIKERKIHFSQVEEITQTFYEYVMEMWDHPLNFS